MTSLPSYDELGRTAEGAPSAWGLFGETDSVGLFNLITPTEVKRAAGLIRRGAVFPLDAAVNAFSPAFFPSRGVPRHRVLHGEHSPMFDDVIDNFYPQASSQWDSLGHMGYSEDQFYNGATAADVGAGRRNTIEHWARRGIVGRAVLLDVARTLADEGRPLDPASATGIEVADLELARQRSEVEFEPGDIVLIRTGFAEWYLEQPPSVRAAIPGNFAAAGLAQSEEMCRYLWDHHVSAVAADNVGLEVFPPQGAPGPFRFLHNVLIGQFGLAIGELWWLADLVADCADDGVYEMFLCSSPMHLPGGIGSPANAIAIK
jgi:kynurenine formamidase